MEKPRGKAKAKADAAAKTKPKAKVPKTSKGLCLWIVVVFSVAAVWYWSALARLWSRKREALS